MDDTFYDAVAVNRMKPFRGKESHRFMERARGFNEVFFGGHCGCNKSKRAARYAPLANNNAKGQTLFCNVLRYTDQKQEFLLHSFPSEIPLQ